MAFCGRVVFTVFIVLVLGLLFVHSDPDLISETCEHWKKSHLDEFEDVNFDGEYVLTKANCGEEVVLVKFTDHVPSVTYAKAESGKKYSIVMVDPDAPSKEKHQCRSWLHWNVGNIEGDNLKEGNIDDSSSDTFTDYNPPSPPQGSGPHRYFLFVFEQKGTLDDNNRNVNSRCRFSIDNYISENGLSVVAMNMFKTENK